MFDIHLFKLEVNIGENFWMTVAGTAGCIGCGYLVYRYIANRKYVKDIEKKCVFITGCDKGLGRHLAKHLDALGIPVFAGCLTKEGRMNLQKETSPMLQTLLVDVTSSNDVSMAAEFVKVNLPVQSHLWGVVNTVGVLRAAGPVEFQKRLDFEQVMQINFLGMVDVNNAFLPQLKKSRGRIINLCSMVARSPTPLHIAYVASKYAVLGYSVALRREKAMWGISVSTIMPNLYQTETINIDKMRTIQKKQWEEVSDDVKEEYGHNFTENHLEMLERRQMRISMEDLMPVVNATEHALFSVSPKKNYMVGRGSGIMSLLESMPSVMDWVSSRTMGIQPKALNK